MMRACQTTLLLTFLLIYWLAPLSLATADRDCYQVEAATLAAPGTIPGPNVGQGIDCHRLSVVGPLALPRVDASIPEVFPILQENDLREALGKSLHSLKPCITLLIADYQADAYADLAPAILTAVAGIDQQCGLPNVLQNWHYLGSEQQIVLHLNYRYSDRQLQQLQGRIDLLCRDTRGKDDYARIQAFHDYLVTHADYYDGDVKPLEVFTAYGALINGQGVCQGYSEAMHLLCHQAGIDSLLVTGQAIIGGQWQNHTWNMVKVGDAYYHLDTTWDDPLINRSGTPLYTYFFLDDKEMSRDHQWDRTAYPACTKDTYNYYVANKLLLADYNEFSKRVQQALQQQVPDLVFKISSFDIDDCADLRQLILQNEQVIQFSYQIDRLHGIITIYNILYR